MSLDPDRQAHIEAATALLHYHLALATTGALGAQVHLVEREIAKAKDALEALKKAYVSG